MEEIKLYEYKGNTYESLNRPVAKMKDPNTGVWLSAYLYTPSDGEETLYVREASDFEDKFIEVTEKQNDE